MEVIDFNDMEHFAYQLLQDSMIKEEMYNKYQMILVDEFQDTNELQEKIIASFCHENNVFRVGDIKQSIYGFRQANPKIMQAWMEKKMTITLLCCCKKTIVPMRVLLNSIMISIIRS